MGKTQKASELDQKAREDLAAMGITEEAFLREVEEAEARGRLTEGAGLTIVDAWYDRSTGEIAVRMENGLRAFIPVAIIEELAALTPEQLGDLQIYGAGNGLLWEKADIYLPIFDVLGGALGSQTWMSSLAAGALGRKTSPAKAAAARANGKKGGRPRKLKEAGQRSRCNCF